MTTIRILGPVEAGADGRALRIGRRRQLKLFAFLVLNANKAVSNDALIEAVWGSAGSGASNPLHMAIRRLRQALGPLNTEGTVLLTVGGGYRLAIEPGELDAEVFKALIEDSHRALEGGDPQRAVELLDRALQLWRGPPLADVAFEDFAQEEIRLLEEKRLELLQTRAAAKLELGRHDEVIARTRRDPHRGTDAGARSRAVDARAVSLRPAGRRARRLPARTRRPERDRAQPGSQARGAAGGDPAAGGVARAPGSARGPPSARGGGAGASGRPGAAAEPVLRRTARQCSSAASSSAMSCRVP